ncbi:MAG: aminotransferase class I/II-fold pyridoxal phosphate-dependent enzyme [Christensenellales bacterium]|jgi:cystathionine beta-lyase family protein involved in aluminum resistance|nr:hypothetical protein [Clostridiales bacterium]
MNELIKIAEKECIDIFEKIDEIALYNQQKVLNAFINRRISPRHFQPSYGYGYDDIGREALSALFADIFHTEDALVSPLIANGTHTINLALLGLLRPNDTLLSVSGKPYDTLEEIINGEGIGSLKDFGIKYRQIEYIDNTFDKCKIIDFLCENSVKMVFIQRSKGYLWQNTITVKEIQEIVKEIKDISKDTIILIDNCYGEFTDIYEPTDFGADLVAGSLIKNPGGGFAPTGGYIAGKADLIDLIAKRLTAPSLGKEVGSYAASYLPYFQGLFMAPSIVKNAMKGCALASKVFSMLGYQTLPASSEMPGDIICAIKFNDKEKLIKFCQSVQRISPIDSNATPMPWDMPGYNHQVIMAAGTFIQGASIELTADAPIKEPYVGYLQGGLTYEHIKLAIAEIIKNL